MNLQNHQNNKNWFVYIIKCSDDTYYTGSAKNLEQRIETHNLGKGAKYTRGRRPVVLEYFETLPDRSSAVTRENAIKKLSRHEKLALIKAQQN
jgi:putative endonuclease